MQSCAILAIGRPAVAVSALLMLSVDVSVPSADGTDNESLDEIVVTETRRKPPFSRLVALVPVQSIGEQVTTISRHGVNGDYALETFSLRATPRARNAALAILNTRSIEETFTT